MLTTTRPRCLFQLLAVQDLPTFTSDVPNYLAVLGTISPGEGGLFEKKTKLNLCEVGQLGLEAIGPLYAGLLSQTGFGSEPLR